LEVLEFIFNTGIRSDSDMYTFGYSFKTWDEQKSFADGPSILKYINER
jgi:cation diffusion facilitator CzcD-associated flavoprotein CzcO